MAHRAIITATVISTYERIFKTVAPKVCWLLTEILSPPTIMTFFPGKTLKSITIIYCFLLPALLRWRSRRFCSFSLIVR